MNTVAALPFLDSLAAIADPARSRVLALLDGRELMVSELCAVLRLPQSTVSRHLKTLGDAGWVASRRDGTSRYYSLASSDGDVTRGQIWTLTRGELAGRVGAEDDLRRLADVLARRNEASRQFFATAAGRWDRLREELFGRDFWLPALLGLLPADWSVGDLGCGTGALVASLAPSVGRVIGVDQSEEMLAAARIRVDRFDNVELRVGALESLPIADGSLDAAVIVLVLHHLSAPAAALAEAHRVLKPGGRLLVVDMAPHTHEEYRREMGHVWLGFSEEQIGRLIEHSRFEHVRVGALPRGVDARGPALFRATANRS